MKCTEKRIYFTEERAVHMKYRLSKVFDKDYHVYQCTNCNYWHLSSRGDGQSPKQKDIVGA